MSLVVAFGQKNIYREKKDFKKWFLEAVNVTKIILQNYFNLFYFKMSCLVQYVTCSLWNLCDIYQVKILSMYTLLQFLCVYTYEVRCIFRDLFLYSLAVLPPDA